MDGSNGPASSSSASQNTSSTPRGNGTHAHLRYFIGPLPDKIVSDTETRLERSRFRTFLRLPGSSDDNGGADAVSELVRDQAFNIYIREGGREENWGEDREDTVVDDLLRRWRESEWARALSRRKGQGQAQRWVGNSFEVGNFLGSNVLTERMYSRNPDNPPSHPRPHALSLQPHTDTPLKSIISLPSLAIQSDSAANTPSAPRTPNKRVVHYADSPVKSPKATKPPRSPISGLPTESGGAALSGQQDLSHTSEPLSASPTEAHYPNEEESPVSPTEVLQRSGTDVQDTSAGATQDSLVQAVETDYNGVVMRDRMLVRPAFLREATVSPHFDEAENRTTRHVLYSDWKEYLVVWRQNRVELYEDYSTPGKEYITGHKHLAHTIFLWKHKINLTIYSFVDLSFCLFYRTTSSRSRQVSYFVLHIDTPGTNIFVFKAKTRSRAVDWYWALWRRLGGEIPPTLEVHNPLLDTRLRVEVPDLSIMPIERAAQLLSRDNLVKLCLKSLRGAGDFKAEVERAVSGGRVRLGLAWRMNTNLDWIWLDEDVRGNPRYWAVLYGLALKQGRTPTHLEIRLGRHYPEHLRTGTSRHDPSGANRRDPTGPNGHDPTGVNKRDPTSRRIEEPLSIEGYVDRIRPNTQTKDPVYLSTHDGFLFFVNQGVAQPPQPPGTVGPGEATAAAHPSLEDYANILRRSEVRRGARQVMAAHAVCELRAIVAVRRAFQVVPPHAHDVREAHAEAEDEMVISGMRDEQAEGDDHADAGGEEGLLDQAGDRGHKKMRRSFELLLRNGHVMRFETHSCKNAIEWITRLRRLTSYWRLRKRIDAQEEMELARARRPLITPHLHPYHRDETARAPEPPPDASAPLPALGSLFNWCVIEGCKPVVRAGRVFMRRGLNGPYKEVRLFLIAGHLVSFRMRRGSLVHRAMKRKLNLVDAYVVSGYFAALALPRGQFSPGDESLPRRYQDGLEADDPEDDLLFMIWYRKQPPSLGPANVTDDGVIEAPAVPPPAGIPALKAKETVAVFRTRSKLERDAWCWAINCEIEKIVREQREREERLRNTGNLRPIR
ncbi:Pleckstrin homology domain-containing protein [Schizophyllum commune]